MEPLERHWSERQWRGGKEFTDWLFASRARAASGSHEFDPLCAEPGIEHRPTPPKSPQSEEDQETVRGTVSPTNGMAERFNGRIADVLKTNRFDSALDLEQTLMRYVALYNRSCRSQPWKTGRRCRP